MIVRPNKPKPGFSFKTNYKVIDEDPQNYRVEDDSGRTQIVSKLDFDRPYSEDE